jgi:hypothetical protein
MDPAIKKVAVWIAAALIVILGLIFAIEGADSRKAQIATEVSQVATETAQIPQNQEADAENKPADVADASEVSKANEAQVEEDAHEIEMYEGALAGLSEDEIAKMALAEEGGKARTETTGTETAVD